MGIPEGPKYGGRAVVAKIGAKGAEDGFDHRFDRHAPDFIRSIVLSASSGRHSEVEK